MASRLPGALGAFVVLHVSALRASQLGRNPTAAFDFEARALSEFAAAFGADDAAWLAPVLATLVRALYVAARAADKAATAAGSGGKRRELQRAVDLVNELFRAAMRDRAPPGAPSKKSAVLALVVALM